MRKVRLLKFKDLVHENKQELLKNNKEIEAIEKRIEEKYARQVGRSTSESVK